MPLSFNFGEENNPELFKGKPKTPVTLISGFLGTGKTTLLKHLLENQEGVRIGVVVNDVAAVNIDSQLVKRYETGLIEVTELQNGCVCCSSADDLFAAVQNVVMRSQYHPFEHIVVELSGVGEPNAVKKNWAVGLECTMPVALRTEIKQVVTVVDASTFGYDWMDTRKASERNEEMHGDKHDEKNVARFENVGQLLAEQVEWADIIVLNKIDLGNPTDIRTSQEVVRALNTTAPMLQATFGKVGPSDVLPAVPKGLAVKEKGADKHYEWSQTAADVQVRMPIPADVKPRDIEFKVSKQSLKLGVKGRSEPSVEGKLFGELKNLDDCIWEIDGSGEKRSVLVVLEKKRNGMWATMWQEPPSKATDSASGGYPVPTGIDRCMVCIDSPEEHVNGYSPLPAPTQGSNGSSSAGARFGIHTFVYQRRRPFSSTRLNTLLKAWPILKKEIFSLEDLTPDSATEHFEAALRPVLRAKGFCWIDEDPLRTQVFAHAGKTLSVQPADWWWSALDKEQLNFKINYPGVAAEYKQVRKSKWDREFGDQRQELVFIGGPDMKEANIVDLFDECLLNDEEFTEYLERRKTMKVESDEFNVNGLLRNLGAPETQIQELKERAEQNREEARLKRKQDREDTEFLRSLGVGCDLEPEGADPFEAVD